MRKLDDVRHAADRPTFVQMREGTVSELCAPLRVEGRVIGVLNLESIHPSNYGPFMPVVEAFAGAIGRTIADGATVLSQSVIDRAARLLDAGHRIHPHLDHALRRARSQEGTDEQILAALSTMRELLKELRRPIVPEMVGPPTDLATLLQRSVSEAAIETDLSSLDMRLLKDVRVSAAVTPIILTTFDNLFKNVKKHAALSATPLALRTSQCVLAGRDLVTLRFLNASRNKVSDRSTRDLYRLPQFTDRGGLRLGTFLAANAVRRVGGYVHGFAVPNRAYDFQTVVLLPHDMGG
jgi:hypothetical protein